MLSLLGVATRYHTILYDGGYTLSGPGTETALVERVVMLATWADGCEAEPAMDVRECYDWVHHRPSPAHYEKYLRVKDQVAKLGLHFD